MITHSLHTTLFAGIAIILVALFSCSPNPQGKQLYDRHCKSCHMEDGLGLKGLIPPLAKAGFVAQNQSNLPCIIRHGLTGDVAVNGKVYNQPMAGIPKLEPAEITNIINYINQAWGNELPYVSQAKIIDQLSNCESD